MRNPVTAFLILSVFYAGAQKQSDTSPIPCMTPQGSPSGKIVSATIGKDGGRLLSGDGKLEIHFSAGALSSDTKITILPITNTVSEANTSAYRLESSGIRFAKPVKLIFHYGGNADEAEFKCISSQDNNGLWWQLRKTETDTISGTVSGYIPHFSDWQLFEKLVLKPRKASINTNATLQLSVYEYSADEDLLEELKKKGNSNYSSDADLLVPLVETSYSADAADLPSLTKTSDADLLQPLKPVYSISEWLVNGIVNGSSETGTIAGKMKLAATYKAPGIPPSQNPVAVTAKLQGISYKAGKQKIRNLSLFSHIEILAPQYRFTFIGASSNMGGVFKMLDSSSCDIMIEGDKIKLVNIINHKPWSDWPQHTRSGCRLEYPSVDAYKGLVEISGMLNGVATKPAGNNGTMSVMVSLAPAMGNTPEIIEICKERRHTSAMPFPAQPRYIRFETDGSDIYVEYMGVRGKNEINQMKKGEGFVVKVVRL